MTDGTVVRFWMAENTAVPVLLDDKLTASAVVVGLANASVSETVIGPRPALDDAGPATGSVRTNLLAAAAATVSDSVPSVSPGEWAVMSSASALMSPK